MNLKSKVVALQATHLSENIVHARVTVELVLAHVTPGHSDGGVEVHKFEISLSLAVHTCRRLIDLLCSYLMAVWKCINEKPSRRR